MPFVDGVQAGRVVLQSLLLHHYQHNYSEELVAIVPMTMLGVVRRTVNSPNRASVGKAAPPFEK
jgi:hypothetical protein